MVPPTTGPSSDDIQMNNTFVEHERIKPFLLDMETYFAIEAVGGVIILPAVSVFGIFANLANIVVYVKMGFQETTNIMFFALSVADLILVISYVISTFGGNGVFDEVNTFFLEMWDIVYIINPFVWAFIGYGSFVTALIALERSVCIALPLKVKTIFTPSRIAKTLVCLTLFPLATLITKYAVMQLVWVTLPATNETRLNFIYIPEKIVFDIAASVVFSTVPSLISFVIVAIGTSFMVVKLNQSVRWRQASAQGTQQKGVSAKEVKVVRSVVIVCSVFIVCFTPNVLINMTGLVYPQFHLSDPYLAPFMHTCFVFSHNMQAISSSMNILIYLGTSTKYKETFMRKFLPFAFSKKV